MSFSSGDRLGPYEILGPLPGAGAAETYHARDTRFNREVAIRVLGRLAEQDGAYLARVELEVKAWASLDHPILAQVYGIVDAGGVLAVAMELVHRGPAAAAVPLEAAIEYGRTIAEVIDDLHRRAGHYFFRKIGPADVVITSEGSLKILPAISLPPEPPPPPPPARSPEEAAMEMRKLIEALPNPFYKPISDLDRRFNDRVRSAVREIGVHTGFGVEALEHDMRVIGAVEAARKRLGHFDPAIDGIDERRECARNSLGRYFLAAKRLGRLDLSIEAIALEPEWTGLFSREEAARAMERLTAHDFRPSIEVPQRMPKDPEIGETASGFGYRFDLPFGYEHQPGEEKLRERLKSGDSECDVTRETAEALRAKRYPAPSWVVENHLLKCETCHDRHSDLVSAFVRFGRERRIVELDALLECFDTSFSFDGEKLSRFVPRSQVDFGTQDAYAGYRQTYIEYIETVCVARAVKAGFLLGEYVAADRFNDRVEDARVSEQASEALRELRAKWWDTGRLGPQLIRQALNIYTLIRSFDLTWFRRADDGFWIPSDEGLASVNSVLCIEPSGDIEEWREIIGPTLVRAVESDRQQWWAILTLAFDLACRGFGENEGSPAEPPSKGADKEDRITATLENIKSLQDDLKYGQDALISLMDRQVAQTPNVSRHQCEAFLREQFQEVWGQLCVAARTHLMQAEQVYRMPDPVNPGVVVQQIATAFELQIKDSVVRPLFGYLKRQNVGPMRAEDGRLLWQPWFKADDCAMGGVLKLLEQPEKAIDEFFRQNYLNRDDICKALRRVKGQRDPASHGQRSYAPGDVDGIRSDWFDWGKRPGGVFSLLIGRTQCTAQGV